MTKRYRCPRCGNIITEEERQQMIEQDPLGGAYCYCEYFTPGEDGEPIYLRILNEYVPIDDCYCTSGEIQASMLLDAHRDPTSAMNPHDDGDCIIELPEQIKKERKYSR